MKKNLLALAALFLGVSSLIAQAPKADLVFVAEFPSYQTWLTNAFNADAERRASYCNEPQTKHGKVSDNMALVYINQFDMSRMGEFAGDTQMTALMETNKIKHSEVYQVVQMNPETAPAKADLFFMITFNDFDGWSKNAFGKDSERRAQFCDESRTKMAKIDDKHAMVILYDFDLARTWEFESNEKVGKLMQQYEVKHEVSLLQSL